MPTTALASWLLTFLLHSTLLGAAALVAARLMRRPEARAVVLRGALLGAVATATLVSSVGFGPSIGVVTPEASRGRPIALRADPAASARAAQAPSNPPHTTREDSAEPVAAVRDLDDRRAAATADTSARSLELALSLALVAAVALGLARFLRHTLVARVHLARRRPLAHTDMQATHGASVAALLADLGAPGGVRVSVCRELDVPLALGPNELVLPERALIELDTDELRALLAHELAHLARRDPLWLGTARLVHALTWFQPLQRVLLRRLEDESELATDTLAVARTGQPLALARTLERVARWINTEPTPTLGVAMARRGATVLTRIERLVAPRNVPAPRTTRRVTVATLCAVALVACAAPKMTTEPRVGLSGAEAFALLAPVIDLADGSDEPIWKFATSDGNVVDFGEHPWRASAPLLVLHLGHDAEHTDRPPIHAFGQQLADAGAAAKLARLATERCSGLVVGVLSTPDATDRSVAELLRALEREDVTASHTVVHQDQATGRRIDALRLGLLAEDAPVRVELYDGPDAEPGEQRFILRLDERGDLRGVPSGQVPFDLVSDRLRSARRGPLDRAAQGPQPEVIWDRVLIECEANTPFEAIQHWLAALAAQSLSVWKTELALAGESNEHVVPVFLPRDAGLADDPSLLGADGLLWADGRGVEIKPVSASELRIDRDAEGLVYRTMPPPREGFESRDPEEITERFVRPGALLTLDIRSSVTFGEVLPVLRTAAERGTLVTLLGSYSPSTLHKAKD